MVENRCTGTMRNSCAWPHQNECFSLKSCHGPSYFQRQGHLKVKTLCLPRGFQTLKKQWKLVSLRDAKRDNEEMGIETMGVD